MVTLLVGEVAVFTSMELVEEVGVMGWSRLLSMSEAPEAGAGGIIAVSAIASATSGFDEFNLGRFRSCSGCSGSSNESLLVREEDSGIEAVIL